MEIGKIVWVLLNPKLKMKRTCIVNVFPDDVCPYAKIVELNPCKISTV